MIVALPAAHDPVITERSWRGLAAIRHAARRLDIQPAWLYIQPPGGSHAPSTEQSRVPGGADGACRQRCVS